MHKRGNSAHRGSFGLGKHTRKNVQFTIASSSSQTSRQQRTNMQYTKLEKMNKEQLKASLVKHKLVKPTSKAPLHILREIASGIFIDGEPL